MIDERLRRQELRATAKALADLVPSERLRQAEAAVRKDAALVDAIPDPQLVDATIQPHRALRARPRRRD